MIFRIENEQKTARIVCVPPGFGPADIPGDVRTRRYPRHAISALGEGLVRTKLKGEVRVPRAKTPPATGGIGPFVTWAVHALGDGRFYLHTARRHRKGLSPLEVNSPNVHPHQALASVRQNWRKFWAPRRLSWWVAVAFMIGAAHFAVAAAADTWPRVSAILAASPLRAGWVYFIGSLFFTTAAYLQWLESVNSDLARATISQGSSSPAAADWRFWGWAPQSLAFWAGLVQFAGTLLFNVNTAAALIAQQALPAGDWKAQDLLVWTPNMTGSVCFLVSGYLAVMEYSHHFWSFRPASLSWWIVMINFLGCVFFQLSALASFVLPGGSALDAYHAGFTTFAGAVCFFVAAYLLIPELFEKAESGAADDR